jgi:hypothetical protein
MFRSCSYKLLLSFLVLSNCDATLNEPVIDPLDSRQGKSSLSLSTNWQLLGPFQIGTRGMAISLSQLPLAIDDNTSFRGYLGS